MGESLRENLMLPWEEKAHRLICGMSRASFEAANRLPTGKLRAKRRPYALPEDATRLVSLLGAHDRVEAERQAKALFQELAFRRPE